VIVRDFNVVGVGADPAETDSPLIVNANAVLTCSITLQLFEPVAGWNAQVFQTLGGIQHSKFAKHEVLEIRREPSRSIANKESLRVSIGETPNHLQ